MNVKCSLDMPRTRERLCILGLIQYIVLRPLKAQSKQLERQEDANISVVILVPSAWTAALLWRISLLMSEVC